jgi:hypothetical protein
LAGIGLRAANTASSAGSIEAGEDLDRPAISGGMRVLASTDKRHHVSVETSGGKVNPRSAAEKKPYWALGRAATFNGRFASQLQLKA